MTWQCENAEGKSPRSPSATSRRVDVDDCKIRAWNSRIGNWVELIDGLLNRILWVRHFCKRWKYDYMTGHCPTLAAELWQCGAVNLAGDRQQEGEIVMMAFEPSRRLRCRRDVNERMMEHRSLKNRNWKDRQLLGAKAGNNKFNKSRKNTFSDITKQRKTEKRDYSFESNNEDEMHCCVAILEEIQH